MGILVRNDSATVGATSTLILPDRRGKRSAYTIINNSTGGQTITLSFGDKNAAVAGYGIPIPPLAYYLEDDARGPCFQGAILAISSAAGGVVAITERIIQDEGK
jgi:hypothetical protein